MLYEIRNNITGEVEVREMTYAEMQELYDDLYWSGDYEIKEIKER